MPRDPIIEEIREVRRRIEQECDHDWEKLFAYYARVQKRMEAEGRRIVPGRPKPLRKAETGT